MKSSFQFCFQFIFFENYFDAFDAFLEACHRQYIDCSSYKFAWGATVSVDILSHLYDLYVFSARSMENVPIKSNKTIFDKFYLDNEFHVGAFLCHSHRLSVFCVWSMHSFHFFIIPLILAFFSFFSVYILHRLAKIHIILLALKLCFLLVFKKSSQIQFYIRISRICVMAKMMIMLKWQLVQFNIWQTVI